MDRQLYVLNPDFKPGTSSRAGARVPAGADSGGRGVLVGVRGVTSKL